MKYAILFGIIATCLTIIAAIYRGWFLLLLWPALSFGAVASGYFRFGPRIFGKSRSGQLAPTNQIFLLPFLVYSWSVWHALRLLSREAAFTQLTDNVLIGRRLLSHELPENIDHIIDLTCEFDEPAALRSLNYHSFQILDALAPTPGELNHWARTALNLPGKIYVHCAQGHGRTGMFAAAMLLQSGKSTTVDDAMRFMKSKRPLIRLNRVQIETLHAMVAGKRNAECSSS